MNSMSFDPLFSTNFVFNTVSFFNSVYFICFPTTQIRNSSRVVSKGKDGPDLNFGGNIHVFFIFFLLKKFPKLLQRLNKLWRKLMQLTADNYQYKRLFLYSQFLQHLENKIIFQGRFGYITFMIFCGYFLFAKLDATLKFVKRYGCNHISVKGCK